ncbi:MAG: metallophosphoesterase family protein [Phycisphaerae bacterium]|nr:metallophosphoesterase family protein [Phycisphaerae bacterium]
MNIRRIFAVCLLSFALTSVAFAQPAAQPDFSIRPYLAACRQTEAILGWATAEPVGEFTVSYGDGARLVHRVTARQVDLPLEYPERSTTQPGRPPRGAPPARKLAWTQYLTTLPDLQPDTEYSYRVEGRGFTFSDTFSTLPRPGTPFTFIAYGDTQDPAVHAKLARQFAAFKPRMIVHTGDTVDDGWLPNYRTDLFDALGGLAGRVPLFPAVGNHDNGMTILRLFRQGAGKARYGVDCGDVHLTVLDSFAGAVGQPKQLEWCGRDLSASKAAWKIVVSHIPTHDAGIHRWSWGPKDFAPLYRKSGVDVVLNGHTHNYQRTLPMFIAGENDTHPITWMVLGGGGGSLHLLPRDPYLAGGESVNHFVVFDASATKLKGRCFNIDGKQIDEFEIVKDAAGRFAPDYLAKAVPEDRYAELRLLIFPCVKYIELSGDPLTGKPVRGRVQMTAGDKAMKFSFRLEGNASTAYDLKPVSGQTVAGGTTPVDLEITLRDPAKYADGTKARPLLRVECLFEIDGKKASIYSGRMVPATQPDKPE